MPQRRSTKPRARPYQPRNIARAFSSYIPRSRFSRGTRSAPARPAYQAPGFASYLPKIAANVASAGLSKALGPAAIFAKPHVESALKGIGGYVSKLFGYGDYKIGSPPKTNSLFQGSRKLPSDPTVTFGSKSVRIQHREYLQDIVTGSANTFTVQNFNVSPSVTTTFPWLSQIANSFQTYRFHGLVVEFKSTSADALNSTNTALGSVIMAADMNSQTFNIAFQSKQEMLNYAGAIDCKPSSNALMGIECDPSILPQPKLYVRSLDDPSSTVSDIRLTDLCSFGVATTGFQANRVTVGELFVIYDIEFFFPQDYIPGSNLLFNAGVFNTGANLANQQTGVTTSGLLGQDNAIASTSQFGNIFPVTNRNGISTAVVELIIPDRSILSNGMIFEFEWYHSTTGTVTSSLSAPNMAAVAGTQIAAPTTRQSVPAANQVGFCVSYQFRFKITDVNALGYPSTGLYNTNNGYPRAAVIMGIVNNANGATNTVPITGTFDACRWSISQTNPLLASSPDYGFI